MTLTLLTALFLEMLAMILLRHRLGRTWLRHPVTLVVLASAVNQAVSPALTLIPFLGAWDYFREGIPPGFAGYAALLTSAAMLAFTIGYLVTCPWRSAWATERVRAAAEALGWKWAAAACVPFAVLTFGGRGYNGSVTIGPASSVGTDLAASFFVIIVALAASGFLLTHGIRWFIPVLAAQSAVLAAAGERTPVLTDAVTLILMAALAGARPRPRQLCGAAVIALAAILAITGLRAQQGRGVFHADSGVAARLSALAEGLTDLSGPSAGTPSPGLAAQVVVRTDGVAFTAAVLQSEYTGQPVLGPGMAVQSLLIVVPSSVWPWKLASPAADAYALEQADFGGHRWRGDPRRVPSQSARPVTRSV